MTWNKLLEEFLIENKTNKESTLVTREGDYNENLKPFFSKKNNCMLGNTTFETIAELHKYLDKKISKKTKKPLSFATKEKLHSFVSVLLDYAKRKRYIKTNVAKEYGNFKKPNDEVQLDKKVRFFTPKEFDLFFSEIDKLIWKAFFNITYWTGMRVGEMQALKWNQINFGTWKIEIISTLSHKTKNGRYKITNTKNRKNRSIDILEQSKQILLELFDNATSRIGFNDDWFVFGGARPLCRTTIDRNIDRYICLANSKLGIDNKIPDLSHHEIGRHSHGSLLAFLEVPKENIATRIGDTLEVIEKYYLHAYKEYKDEKIIQKTRPDWISQKMNELYSF